ncbi:NADH dehydrogenase [ubiquinone] iron-sulfur protein 5 [Chelmon rostratus]|uniref:NADH dehydrogenase [ubiquinone] iron-sulfur protein 5 n=1 Tax=Chelmon rostratus TaxID=109905 RepID=UPI001BE9A64F|nr:NADH dehydrogenase [ubiquinone] iron-sulfur protein 5 [Chelmon rostratus]
MPFLDLKSRLGVGLDRWLLLQSGEQPNKRAARCHAFEKEWVECSHGIGKTRATKECQLEFEDFYECMHRQKTRARLYAIRQQRDKMVKEGTYTPPPSLSGQAD